MHHNLTAVGVFGAGARKILAKSGVGLDGNHLGVGLVGGEKYKLSVVGTDIDHESRLEELKSFQPNLLQASLAAAVAAKKSASTGLARIDVDMQLLSPRERNLLGSPGAVFAQNIKLGVGVFQERTAACLLADEGF